MSPALQAKTGELERTLIRVALEHQPSALASSLSIGTVKGAHQRGTLQFGHS